MLHLTLEGGITVIGEDLIRIAKEALQAQGIIDRMKHRAPDSAISQLTIAGALQVKEDDKLIKAGVQRLDMIADEGEDGWSGQYTDGDLVFERNVRGVTDRVILRYGFRDSSEARRLHKLSAFLSRNILRTSNI